MKAISSMATRHLLGDLFAAAGDAGLPHVELTAVGGVDAAERVAAGAPFDLVILADDALRRLAADGHIVAGTVAPLVLSQVAVAVPSESVASAGRPEGAAFADADELRAALRAVDRIGYSTGPSGTALVRMITAWGLAEELGPRLVQARPGVPVATLLAHGEAEIGFQQLSELVGQPGVRILGVLPDDAAIDTVFAGAVTTTSTDPPGARALLAFLSSAEAAALASTHSFTPV
ncbi:substrate-binding domain-containing protein [Microbacterium sp. ASV81]|uniref:Substrate-binding domain-containing protein n=1 Tax=Microbacterium capsulatum TaxID=3041921 RepID=A0ABU0XBQ0_9MICO|nr:substrate-binding domain-containing protein [Microbacterium sp. ASV81]MDQ4212536.1 substrate-binding domain-containing protein [Microbacterium sp. ASV81]